MIYLCIRYEGDTDGMYKGQEVSFCERWAALRERKGS